MQNSNQEIKIGDKKFNFRRNRHNLNIPEWMMNKNSALQKNSEGSCINSSFQSFGNPPKIYSDSIIREDLNKILIDDINLKMEKQKQVENLFTNNNVTMNQQNTYGTRRENFRENYENHNVVNDRSRNFGRNNERQELDTMTGKKRRHEEDDDSEFEKFQSQNVNQFGLNNLNNLNNNQNNQIQSAYGDSRIESLMPPEINVNCSNINVQTLKSKKSNFSFPNEVSSKEGYDGFIDNFSDEDAEVQVFQNNNINSNNNLNYKDFIELTTTEISRMNPKDVNYYKQTSNVKNGFQMRKEIKEMDRIIKEKALLNNNINQNRINNDNQRKDNNKVAIKPFTNIDNQIYNQSSQNNSPLQNSQNNSILQNFIPKENTQRYLKLFYNEKEILAYLSISMSKLKKSILNFEYLLENEQFMKLKILEDFEIILKLEVNKLINTDEGTNQFFNSISNDKVAICEDLNDFLILIHFKNEIIKSLNFENKDSLIKNHKEGSLDLIIIIKINEDNKKDKIRKIIKEMMINKIKISNSFNSLNNHVNNSSVLDNDISIHAGLMEFDDLVEKEKQIKKLEEELKQLREFKYNHKSVLEEAVKRKETELNQKVKIHYEITCGKFKEKIVELEKQIEKRQIELDKQISEKSEIKNKNEKLEKINDNLNEKTSNLIEMNNNLQQKSISKETEIKNKILSLEREIEEMKKNEKNLKDEINKLKLVEKQTGVVKIDEYTIEEKFDEIEGLDNESKKSLIRRIEELSKLSENFSCICCTCNPREILAESCSHLIFCEECLITKINMTNLKELNRGRQKKRKIEHININENIFKFDLNCPICFQMNSSFRKIIIS